MWDSLPTRVRREFPPFVGDLDVTPRDLRSGTGLPAFDRRAYDLSFSEGWDARLAEMRTYAAYENDWDGQGAEAIPAELFQSVLELSQSLRDSGIAAPSCVTPGISGTISMEWLLDDRKSVEIEVTAPGTAEVFFYVPGQSVQHWELKEKVIA